MPTQNEVKTLGTIGIIRTPSGETIKVDGTDLEKRVEEKLKKYIEELKDYKPKDKDGKGVIESFTKNSDKLIEQLRQVKNTDITEQWTIAIPALTTKEVAAHLRDYVFISEILKGEPGDTVNIPYVKDFDFRIETTPGAASLTAKSSLISTLTTVLKEAGAYSDIAYGDIEKIDQNLLDELNRTFAHAAVRAEDKALIDMIATQTTNDFAGGIGGGTGTEAFYVRYIPEAIGKLIEKGKEVHPGDLVLYMTAKGYADLLLEMSGSQVFAYARGDIVQKGVIEELLGVRILVGGEEETVTAKIVGRTTSTTTGTCQVQFLMRARRCLALAPKRDILIETDRQIRDRKLRIAGSHTFGEQIIDATECVRIFSGHQ